MNLLHHVDRLGRDLAEEVGEDGLDMLIKKHINPDPHGFGRAEARTLEHGVSVWVIVGELQGSEGDICYAADSHRISVDSVRGALAFYWRNRMLMRARMAIHHDDPAYVQIEA